MQEPGEAEPQHDALQVLPEDPVLPGTLVTSRSRIIPLLPKLAYDDRQFSSKEGFNYVYEKEKWANCVPLAVRR